MKSFVVWLAVCWTLTAGQTQSTMDQRVLYTGFRLLSVGPLTCNAQVIAMELFLKSHKNSKQVVLSIDSRLSVNMTSWLTVAPDAFDDVSSFLSRHEIPFEVVNDDIQRTMDENARLNAEALNAKTRAIVDHTAYIRYNDQILWMQERATAAGTIAMAFSIGTSSEGRSIYAVGINNENANLPAVWLHGNANARDWLSSATALYIIDQILTGISDDSVFLRTNFRFFIVPNLNPDGYEYTWDVDRVWTKTLSLNANQVNCSVPKGVFAVRNFDANFGGAGCDPNPCSATYCGSSAFSEPETASVRDLMASITGTAAMFISLDSFSQQWLVPFGCQLSKPTDFDELNRVALKAVDAVYQVNQLNFSAGTPVELSGVSTGGGFDWSKLTQGFRYAYSVHTRPASAGLGGFDVPPDQIIPSGREVFAGLATACREIQLI